jgi:hypothetical protein
MIVMRILEDIGDKNGGYRKIAASLFFSLY